MQFRLRTLLAVVTYLSVIFALVFAAPPIVAWPLLGLLLFVSPAVWVAGIVYGRGMWRAFFIAGTIAGLAPFIGTTLVTGMYAFQMLSEIVDDPSTLFSYGSGATARATEIGISCFLISSGPIAGIGGLLGCFVYRCFLPTLQGEARVVATGEAARNADRPTS